MANDAGDARLKVAFLSSCYFPCQGYTMPGSELIKIVSSFDRKILHKICSFSIEQNYIHRMIIVACCLASRSPTSHYTLASSWPTWVAKGGSHSPANSPRPGHSKAEWNQA